MQSPLKERGPYVREKIHNNRYFTTLIWHVAEQFLLTATVQNIKRWRNYFIEVTKRPERLSRGWQIALIMPSNGLGLL